jgi:hypothetical protein
MKSMKNDIQKFEEYCSSMYEAFNSPLSISWEMDENSLTGFFSIGDDYYKISCLEYDFNIWTYKFFILDKNKNEFSQTSKGDPNNKLKVLSTIRFGMEYLINSENPNSLIFMAADDSESRKKIYFSFVEELEKKFNYKLISNRKWNYQIYILYKNVELDIVLNQIDKMKNEI